MKNPIKYAAVVASVLVIGVVILGITRAFIIELDSFGYFVVYAGIALGLYSICDNVFLRSFNTSEELRSGNIAYAIKLLSFAIIISACVVAA